MNQLAEKWSMNESCPTSTNPSISLVNKWTKRPSSNSDDKIHILPYRMLELSEAAKKILGKNGIERFELFKTFTQSRENESKKMSASSLTVMEIFLARQPRVGSQPSLFLTPNGNLQLGWESSDKKSVEIEFYPDRVEFYIEANDHEESFELYDHQINKLISELNAIG